VRKFSLLEPMVAASVMLVLVSNVISQKFFDITVFGIPLTTDVGTLLLFPFAYILADVLTEVYGFATSRRVIWYAFAANGLAALVFSAAVALPHSPDFTQQEAFASVLGQVPGLVVASLAGAWFGSFANDTVLAAMKMRMIRWDPTHRWLPLRTIASTVVGQGVDTALFVGVATAFDVFPSDALVSLILSQWLIKTAVEVAFTPVTVWVIRAVKRWEGQDVVGTETFSPFAFTRDGGQNLFRQP